MTFQFDWLLFLMGIIGAWIFIFLSKREAIPQFPPIFSASTMQTLSAKIQSLEQQIATQNTQRDETDKALKGTPPPSSQQRANFEKADQIDQSQISELNNRLTIVEAQYNRRQAINETTSYIFGIVSYLIVGGFLGAVLPSTLTLQIVGENGAEVPKILQSLVVGATWTSFLSAFGLSINKDKVERVLKDIENIENNQNFTATSLPTPENTLSAKIKEAREFLKYW